MKLIPYWKYSVSAKISSKWKMTYKLIITEYHVIYIFNTI